MSPRCIMMFNHFLILMVLMKNKVQFLAALWLAVSCGSAFASVEDYVVAVDKINRTYKADVRQFFGQLNPPSTPAIFCPRFSSTKMSSVQAGLRIAKLKLSIN